MSKIYIVATPIGNLEDITLRALDTLKDVDIILAEDTRVSRKLLDHYSIRIKIFSWHQHSKDWSKVKNFLEQDKDIAYISDAGTPGISDPGGKLIQLVLNDFPDTKIIPIPGVSALSTIISIGGIPLDRFEFLGFLPHKKGRKTLIEYIKESKIPIIFFESVHRVLKTLESLKDCDKEIIIGRELTKKFETIYRGNAKEILEILEKDKIQVKGEFTILINK